MLIENKNQYDKLLDEISGNDLVKFEIIINDAFLIIRTTKDRYQLRIAQLENRIWQLKMGSKPEMFEPIINQLPNFDPSDLYKFINNPDVFINKSETDLIFGADRTENVVSIEINEDGNVEIFKEINGEIQIEHRNYKFWMVSNKAPSKSDSTKLDGGLFYRNLIEYNTKKDFFVNRKIAKNRGVEVFSISNEKEQFMVKNGLTYFKNSQISDVSVLSFDIETTSLRPEDGQVLMISNTFRKCGKITKKLFSIDEFHGQNINPESAMIRAWCTWVRSVDPSIMIGHNIYSFDLAYLNDRYQEGYNGNLPIGRDGSGIKISTFPSKFRKDGSQAYDYFKIQIYGREIVDTWFLSMKYDFKRNYPSYKLKEIIEYEGLIKEGRTFYDASTIRDNWDNLSEREKIKKYCIDDSDDSLALYDLMVPMYFYYTRSIPKPFQMINESATGSQLNALMVRSYLQIGHSLPTPTPVDSFQGATSLGVPGIYQNVFKIDVQSLYPSIIIQYQLYDKYKDPNAHYLKLVEYFTNERLNNKRKGQETNDGYYKDLEQGQKIAINSFYGLTGANGLIYNSPKIASKITQYGREILDISVRWATSESVEY